MADESKTQLIERAKRDPLATLALLGALGLGTGGLAGQSSVTAKLETLTVSMAKIEGAIVRASETEKAVGELKAVVARQDALISTIQADVRRLERDRTGAK